MSLFMPVKLLYVHTLTWFYVAVVPGYGRIVGVTPGAMFVFIRISAVVSFQASRQHAPLPAEQTQTQKCQHLVSFLSFSFFPSRHFLKRRRNSCRFISTCENVNEFSQIGSGPSNTQLCRLSPSRQDNEVICRGITHLDSTFPPTFTYLILVQTYPTHEAFSPEF